MPVKTGVSIMVTVRKLEGKNEVYYAYCPVCKAVYSGFHEGNQGDYYIHTFMDTHKLSFFKLNNRNRCIEFEGEFPEDVKRTIIYIWSLLGNSDMYIFETINVKEKFEETLREMERLEKATPPPPPRAKPNLFLLFKTQRTPASIISVEKYKDGELEECRDIFILDAVLRALSELPQHIKLPEDFWNCKRPIPRRYMLAIHYDASENEAEIIDIQSWSVKKRRPGKWSYRNGYWAPVIHREVIETLKQHIKTLIKAIA
ncbi:MAG: hypothetical protein JHC26_10400 [Thermofilum sp.]|uniref:hypothetical protein n=1 Tax=Thermofilum sp. TaxID=1961369 RepID=UPI00258B0A58|nr:hypothetical protein [Thermofilum sp.]MCI4409490.1 hypothetical protein [Thermofilum sp.]